MLRTYLVIGAGPGISTATAGRFAREGYRIILAGRSLQRLEGIAAALRESGAEVRIETVDAAHPAAVDDLVRRNAEEISVLHYNAGVLRFDNMGQLAVSSLDRLALDEIVHDITVNITSAIVAIRAIVPTMTTHASGTILLTGGGIAISPFAGLLPLSAGKAAIRNIAEALARPLRIKGIRFGTVTVNDAVAPGSRECEEIANYFWELHTQAMDDPRWEIVHSRPTASEQ